MTPTICTALGYGGRSVQITLYEESRALFTRMREWASPGDSSDEMPELSVLEEPLAGLTGELFRRPIDTSVESIRRERAQTAVAYMTFRQQTELPASEGLAESVRSWSEGERSRGVQQVLEEAMKLAGGVSR